MSSPPLKRRLTTILASDAVGYSRLVSESEEEALRVLAAHRAVIDGIIEFHEGRIINTAGDSVLAEFASPVQAVRCAVEIQDALKTRNDALPGNRRMLFRIGVNLGDVMVKGDDLLGDGVNVAARLESIAEPGGICISSSVYDQITGKLNLSLSDMGEQALKNITRPIRTYRIQSAGAPPAGAPLRKVRKQMPWRAAVLLVLAGVAAALWLPRLREAAAPAASSVGAPPPDAAARERAQAAAEAQHAREEAAAVRRAAEADAARIRAEAEAAKATAEADALRARAKADAEARRARDKAQAEAARIEARAAAKRRQEEAAAAKARAAAAKAREEAAARAAARQHEKAAQAVALGAPAPQAAAPAPQAPDPARFDGAWQLKLSCPPWNGARMRESEADATMTAGRMVAQFGYNGHPGFFRVHGALADDDTLVLHGGGIAGGRFRGRVFGIRIPGRFEGASYRGEGWFGHRHCVVTLQR